MQAYQQIVEFVKWKLASCSDFLANLLVSLATCLRSIKSLTEKNAIAEQWFEAGLCDIFEESIRQQPFTTIECLERFLNETTSNTVEGSLKTLVKVVRNEI